MSCHPPPVIEDFDDFDPLSIPVYPPLLHFYAPAFQCEGDLGQLYDAFTNSHVHAPLFWPLIVSFSGDTVSDYLSNLGITLRTQIIYNEDGAQFRFFEKDANTSKLIQTFNTIIDDKKNLDTH